MGTLLLWISRSGNLFDYKLWENRKIQSQEIKQFCLKFKSADCGYNGYRDQAIEKQGIKHKEGGGQFKQKTINICEKAAAYNEIKRFVEIQVVSHESNVPNY